MCNSGLDSARPPGPDSDIRTFGQTASSRRRSLVDEPGDVVQFIRSVSAGFPTRSLVLETIGTGAMSRQAGHPLMPHYEARFKWAVDDVHSLMAGSPYSVASSKFWRTCGVKSANACRS